MMQEEGIFIVAKYFTVYIVGGGGGALFDDKSGRKPYRS